MIKKSRIFILFLPVFCLLFSSCFIFGDPTYYHYYKSFFLDEESFVIDGQVFSNFELTEPAADFTEVMVKTHAVDGWEICGEKKSGNVFEIKVTITANGITLSKDTINPDYTKSIGQLSTGASICFLEFNINDELGHAFYEVSNYCEYVYVLDPVTLSGIETKEEYMEWHHYDEYHYDCDFSKPGWYKIVYSEQPIGIVVLLKNT